MKNRKQYGSSLATTEVRSGVPQGSLLGILMFIIYIHEVEAEVEEEVEVFEPLGYVDNYKLVNFSQPIKQNYKQILSK